jgi:hypothetical protein
MPHRDILKIVLVFEDVPAGESATQPHRILIKGVSQLPDYIEFDNGAFTVSGDDTEVTVVNESNETASVNVLVEHWHSIPRVFGAVNQESLAVRPYISGPGMGGAPPSDDELVKVSDADTTSGKLDTKLAAGSNISLAIANPGGDESVVISANVPPDELVKVSDDDTTAGKLDTKLSAGANISLSVANPGGDESVVISANVPGTADPITVRGDTNADGASGNHADAEHQHRLELEVEDEGALAGARPAINFVGVGVGAVDNPAEDRVDITIPGTSDGGAVVKRSLYKSDTVSTSGNTFVDAMSGSTVAVPIDGDYWAIFEGEGMNSNANAVMEIGISVNSTAAVIAGSERDSQGNASDHRVTMTTVQLPGLVAGDLIRTLFRKSSGAQSVSLMRRHLSIFKVQ